MATPIPENRASFTAEEIVAATGASVDHPLSAPIVGVETDSRRVSEGNLFVALRGEVHDAHEYLDDVARAGAGGVLVDREVELPPEVGVFRVTDTLEALGALGAAHRARFSDLPVIAITGSVGKTTTKELLEAALEGLGRSPIATRGNLNNRIGVPMTLFTIDSTHDAAVVEMGMNEPGEIAALATMAAPTIGLVTSVAEVHTEGVGGIAGVAREKGALLRAIGSAGAIAFCADDAPLREQADTSPAGQTISYGRDEHAALRLLSSELVGHGGTRAHYEMPEGEKLELTLRLLGEHAAVNAAGALAVAHVLAPGRVEDAARALETVAPALHRMAPVELPSGLLVIDDTYNSSPRSTVAALETCAALATARGGRLVVALGDMLELGARERAMHEDVGREAIRLGASAVIACGERMSHAGRAALQATMDAGPGSIRAKVVILRKVEDVADCVRELAEPRDVVLVKGSRGMRMERVVAALEGAES